MDLDSYPVGSKQTKRDSLLQVWRSTGRKPKQLVDLTELPEELAYLWEWYQEIVTHAPLTYTEINHWSQITHRFIKGYEAGILCLIDRIIRKKHYA